MPRIFFGNYRDVYILPSNLCTTSPLGCGSQNKVYKNCMRCPHLSRILLFNDFPKMGIWDHFFLFALYVQICQDTYFYWSPRKESLWLAFLSCFECQEYSRNPLFIFMKKQKFLYWLHMVQKNLWDICRGHKQPPQKLQICRAGRRCNLPRHCIQTVKRETTLKAL